MKQISSPEGSNLIDLFDSIAPRYEVINFILSLGLDRYWRRKLAQVIPFYVRDLLDCATGTGNMIRIFNEWSPWVVNVVGLDPSAEMLTLARSRCREVTRFKPRWEQGVAEHIPFHDESFGVVTMAFGLRNTADMLQALREMYRVLRPNGYLCILEFSHPSEHWMQVLHRLYLRYIVRKVGGWLSGYPSAYDHLASTIDTFPCGWALGNVLKTVGFRNVVLQPLSGGIVTVYRAQK